MTIAQLDKELKSIIDQYSVYGAECILKSLIRACRDEQYLEPYVLQHIFDHVMQCEEKLVISIDSSSIYPPVSGIHIFGGDNHETHTSTLTNH